MDGKIKTIEQYCCVLQRNVIMEETGSGDQTKRVCRSGGSFCAKNGGCTNRIFCSSPGAIQISD